MNKYIKEDEWSIIEEGFEPSRNVVSESLFSTGNGKFGNRANFEEYYSGPSLLGNYISGIYYPDKTKVGWWKNGYPEYFAKVLNAPNWLGVKVKANGNRLDIAEAEIVDFRRELNMKNAILSKTFGATLATGEKMSISSERLISMANDEISAIQYNIHCEFDGTLEILLDIDGDISNSDSNYDEKFWTEVHKSAKEKSISVQTKKTHFQVAESFEYKIFNNNNKQVKNLTPQLLEEEKYIGHNVNLDVKKGDTIRIEKYVSVCSSLYHESDSILAAAKKKVKEAAKYGYDKLKNDHSEAWAEKWNDGDIIIDGDVAAQQGIRFNIFQMHQTYTGKDPRLNIGPKGLTGEKYGGSTYWDTEAYCLPFYMSSAPKEVSLNLLKYRYNHLDKAIENAEKLGFSNGAALYPMVTMNGEECHNEWEITFEEIHRNGAIAYAIFNYIRYFDDDSYLLEGGLEVLIAISRFWAQRVNYSKHRRKYVMLGVTGPNEYENNVNNNWYTNTIATWCMRYTLDCVKSMDIRNPEQCSAILEKVAFKKKEKKLWKDIVGNMYYPKVKKSKIFLQQDGFLDKDLKPASSIDSKEVPIHENWSWDRILRSCFIKQADVLQGLWFFEDEYDIKTIKKNFEFYEPLTVHESSLSSCIHSIQATLLGKKKKAYQYYLNASRLDLDDYNNDSKDGLHITSMGGTWMTIVYGFAGMRVKDNILSFQPSIPKNWNSIGFKLSFRDTHLHILLGKEELTVINKSGKDLQIMVSSKKYKVKANSEKVIAYE